MATTKQVNYLLLLLSRNGYSTRFMNSQFKRLGARMRERRGTVTAWLCSLDIGRASALIDQLTATADMARIAAAMVGPQLPKQQS